MLEDEPLLRKQIGAYLERLGADAGLITVAGRQAELVPHPPPGMKDIIKAPAGARHAACVDRDLRGHPSTHSSGQL